MGVVNNGILNDYTIKPRNLAQYSAFRGTTDFTQVGQFDQYENGYQFLAVISLPKFMEKLGEQDDNIKNLNAAFKHKLEYEFRGLDGLPDMQAETYQINDGINNLELIGKVSRDTAPSISSSYYETHGSILTKWTNLYLTGIKDPISQAKTYHGLIKNNLLEPGPENEVFTMMYFATDSTMLRLEKAVLLTNCQFQSSPESMYNGTRSDIGNNQEHSLEWKTFPVYGYEVDKAASKLLEDITGVNVTSAKSGTTYKVTNTTGVAVLDSAEYKWGIMDESVSGHDVNLTTAINS
jgi:hypothetical protein